MSFVQEHAKYNWDDIRLSIYAKSARDVERALSKTRLDLEDFKALISPAAEPFLEQMAQRSFALTRKRFRQRVSMFLNHRDQKSPRISARAS